MGEHRLHLLSPAVTHQQRTSMKRRNPGRKSLEHSNLEYHKLLQRKLEPLHPNQCRLRACNMGEHRLHLLSPAVTHQQRISMKRRNPGRKSLEHSNLEYHKLLQRKLEPLHPRQCRLQT
jgi:hypothetical protein